jgi:hypothetical protein
MSTPAEAWTEEERYGLLHGNRGRGNKGELDGRVMAKVAHLSAPIS